MRLYRPSPDESAAEIWSALEAITAATGEPVKLWFPKCEMTFTVRGDRAELLISVDSTDRETVDALTEAALRLGLPRA